MVLLCGAATAAAGPIGFVGLMVPHAVRMVAGVGGWWLTAFSMLGGAALVLVSDVVGRVLVRPDEVPVGIVTAFVGAPILVILVRRLVRNRMTSARSGNKPYRATAFTVEHSGSIDFGRPVIRWRIGGLSGRWDRREVVVGTVAAVATVVVAIVALGMGDSPCRRWAWSMHCWVPEIRRPNSPSGSGRRPGARSPRVRRRTRPVRGPSFSSDPQSARQSRHHRVRRRLVHRRAGGDVALLRWISGHRGRCARGGIGTAAVVYAPPSGRGADSGW